MISAHLQTDLDTWRGRLAAGPLFPSEKIEALLAKRKQQSADQELLHLYVDLIRRATNNALVAGLIEDAATAGEEAASEILRRLDNDYRYVQQELHNLNVLEAMRVLNDTHKALNQAEALAKWNADAPRRNARKPRKKRAGWQRAVADYVSSTVGGTKKQQLAAIPERTPGILMRFNDDEIEVYKDGDRLVCEIGGHQETVALSTFHDTYLKKSGTVNR
ncbi:hypothetical protein ACSBOB_18565 [Mesorhizobium sp. ASY16-5R]|uniref:hypothetical protein n=1 Tax=Mesorhizobium sp. ASY16-5R TaxID=3445772 RepID=UPI003F9F9D11